MYQVIIADDEELIRRGLRNFIPWEELGFTVAAEFDDGAPVIEYLKTHTVDLIFSDVRMVQATGLDVAKYVCENQPDTIVCLISGYKDFEYAQTAMRYHVDHYIVKPTDIEEVTELVGQLKFKIDGIKSLRRQQDNYQELLEMAQQQFLADVFMGNFENQEELMQKAQSLNLANADALYCPFWISIPSYAEYVEAQWKYDKECFFTAVCNFVNDNKNQFQIQNIMMSGEELLFVASSAGPCGIPEFKTMVDQHLQATQQSIKCMLSLEIEYQSGRVFQTLSEFVTYLSQPIWIDTGELVRHAVLDGNPGKYNLLLELYKNVILSVLLSRQEQLKNHIESIMGVLSRAGTDETRKAIEDFFKILFSKLSNITDRDLQSIFGAQLKNLAASQTKEELKRICMEILTALTSHINSTENSAELIIARAKKYIEANYAKDLSLDDVANYVFLNSAYFSRFFKKHTNENFRDYLINLKIQKAIELIREDKYKIYEISEMVGYKNSKYFTYQFKQVTGLSPKEYTANIKLGEELETD